MSSIIKIAEGSNGVNHTITIYQDGSNTPEDLTGYTGATLTVTELDLETVLATITLAITTAESGLLTYTTSTSHGLPAVATGKRNKELKAQIKITGSGLKDITEIGDFIIVKDISV